MAFLAAKQNQQHAIDLYWKMAEKKAMMWPNLEEQMLDEAVMTPLKALTSGIASSISSVGADAPGTSYYDCGSGGTFPGTTATSCSATAGGPCCTATPNLGPMAYSCGTMVGGQMSPAGGYACTKKKGGKGL